MTRKDFIREVAAITGVTQGNIQEILEACRKVTVKAVQKEDEIKLLNGVTIYGKKIEPHTARNPVTGGTIEVPARIRAKVRFAPSFKEDINK